MSDEFMNVFQVGSVKPDVDYGQKTCKDSECLDKLPLAMAYVPMQKWGSLYDPDVALERGTLFEDLDFPFLGKEGLGNGTK